tara:strand:+ start:367 stop:903 length:537 start_codon:yes stop_codon:yes gene_type:complete
MIIACNNCHKKFDIDSKMIPENGRLLQCNGCNYQWFFKKDMTNEPLQKVGVNNNLFKEIEPSQIEKTEEKNELTQIESSESIVLLDKKVRNDIIDKVVIKNNSKKIKNDNLELGSRKNKKTYNILGSIIVFIFSCIGLIIIVDTFQNPISRIFPNINFLLYNLYETIKDVILFFNDLI